MKTRETIIEAILLPKVVLVEFELVVLLLVLLLLVVMLLSPDWKSLMLAPVEDTATLPSPSSAPAVAVEPWSFLLLTGN